MYLMSPYCKRAHNEGNISLTVGIQTTAAPGNVAATMCAASKTAETTVWGGQCSPGADGGEQQVQASEKRAIRCVSWYGKGPKGVLTVVFMKAEVGDCL